MLGMFRAELVKRLRRVESCEELYRFLDADDVLIGLGVTKDDEKPYYSYSSTVTRA